MRHFCFELRFATPSFNYLIRSTAYASVHVCALQTLSNQSLLRLNPPNLCLTAICENESYEAIEFCTTTRLFIRLLCVQICTHPTCPTMQTLLVVCSFRQVAPIVSPVTPLATTLLCYKTAHHCFLASAVPMTKLLSLF